jgi:hypothetical protein
MLMMSAYQHHYQGKHHPGAAITARTASGNALARTEVDDVAIVPIFHKLLTRRRGLSPASSSSAVSLDGGKFSAVASCPNIVVKCDIVEYL